MKLSNNITLEKITYSSTAIRNGINNVPTDKDIILNLKNLCKNILEPIIEKYGDIQILSGYRCIELNKKVGGSKNSQHCKGQAVDINIKDYSIKKIFNLLKKSDLKFDQLINEFDSWIHISWNNNPRKQSLIAKKINGKTIYEIA